MGDKLFYPRQWAQQVAEQQQQQQELLEVTINELIGMADHLLELSSNVWHMEATPHMNAAHEHLVKAFAALQREQR